jgi:hypothetical protein
MSAPLLQRPAPRVLAGLAALLLALPVAAQSNVIPGTDVALGDLGQGDDFKTWGRQGTYPNGFSGVSLSSTSCNKGSIKVPWKAAGSGTMEEDHPFLAFLLAREKDGRFEQISDRSFVKHAFFAQSNSYCDPCQGGSPLGVFLGIGCSDTYTADNNGMQYWLAPAGEIDPWLGEWEATCSYFDQGVPSVGPPGDCNGQRSLNNAFGFTDTQARVQVRDQDLIDPTGNADFWYQCQYVVRGEPEANRTNNLGSKRFTASWSGNAWTLDTAADPLLAGTILGRWSGATVTSATNGTDDGRVYVAVKVTGPVQGFYRYEYALHNRDNLRGVDALRIPTCADARVVNAGFRDVDQDPVNDWSFTRNPTEIVFDTPGNPLAWNTIYNFWFDSDAAPETMGLTLDAFAAGAGASSFVVSSTAPTGLYNVHLGPGCSTTATPPSIWAIGTPPQATIDNSSFGFGSAGNDPRALTLWVIDLTDGPLNLGGGCTYYGGALVAFVLAFNAADAGGVSTVVLDVPNDPTLEGATIVAQQFSFRAAGGPISGLFDMSDGLRVRIGNLVGGCP